MNEVSGTEEKSWFVTQSDQHEMRILTWRLGNEAALDSLFEIDHVLDGVTKPTKAFKRKHVQPITVPSFECFAQPINNDKVVHFFF